MTFATVSGTTKLKHSILERNEDHFIDFKSKEIKPAKLQETFVAFANTDGGELYVGVESMALRCWKVLMILSIHC
jgi:ATP-dependent DNA helicase RecG